jgi:hypothetical protein
MTRQPDRGTHMASKEPNEKKIRQKILKALKQKVDGKMTRLKQSELNIVAGKTNVRAAFLENLLRKMKEEKLIDHHYWQTNTTRKRSGTYWALFKHPENVKAREKREKYDEEHANDPPVTFMSLSEYADLLWKKGAGRRAKEKFQEDIGQYLADNYDEIWIAIRRIQSNHTRKTNWLHSRQWL